VRSIRAILAVFLVSLFFGSTVGSAVAQEAAAEATPGGPSEGYPVSIHEGTCAEPTSEPAWEIGTALSIGVGQEEPEVVGAALTRTITATSNDLDLNIDSVVESDHLIAVHASPEEENVLVACGQIAGIKVNGELVVALVPVGDSQVNGIAIINEDSAGMLELEEGQSRVIVYVVTPDNESATPEA
jgi:hypothetical protein